MMPGALVLPLILSLCPVQGAHHQGSPGITPELPAGGAAFRARMLDARAEAPAPEPRRAKAPAPRRATAALPPLSSRFGVRRDPIHGALAVHRGIDIPGPHGTPVLASAAGIVRFAGGAGGYGTMVEIDHGGVLQTRYGHLSRLLVRPGTQVAPGQIIALMGSTGRATGSHLHFEVRLRGRAVDPQPYLTGATSPPPSAPATWNAPETPYLSSFARARAAQANPQDVIR